MTYRYPLYEEYGTAVVGWAEYPSAAEDDVIPLNPLKRPNADGVGDLQVDTEEDSNDS